MRELPPRARHGRTGEPVNAALDGDARCEAVHSAAPGGQKVGMSQTAGAEPRALSAVRGRGSDPGGGPRHKTGNSKILFLLFISP